MRQGSDEELPEFGVPVLCHMFHTDRLKFADFSAKFRSDFRAGIVDGKSLIISNLAAEDCFTTADGRSVDSPLLKESLGSPFEHR